MALVKQVRNSKHQFGWMTILLHWLAALAVIGMYPLGLYIVSLSYYDPGYRIYPDIHRSIGILLAMLLAFRLLWRLVNPSPVSLSHIRWERLAASAGHIALYALVLVVILSGYMLSTADGRSISVFNWFSVPAIPSLATRQEELAGTVHFYAATGLIVMASIHALAALKHHYLNRDNTLRRILGLDLENNR
ncbi:cytochrome b [Nitrincola sp. MINF-07-Sa-05]|uniref:cytochrome b n=1 Tax=Nitrincola salilacus TaxID=3400273 RepID=UPI003917F483